MTVLRFSIPLSRPMSPGGRIPYVPAARVPAPPDKRPHRMRRVLRTLLRAFWRRHQSRMELLRMDPHMLKDIGMTFAEAEHEANKPFWRV